MKQTLLLLAGYPGTGKSFLANMIMNKISAFVLCSPDDIKETYWDAYGFQSLNEKENLISRSWVTYYQQLECYFVDNKSVISDYPFSEKQKNKLNELTSINKVQIMTIRLVGDITTLFERQKKRDIESTRHLGHISLQYHKGMQLNHEEADNLLDYEEFNKRCTTRGYGEFALGETIEIDVSDFSCVDYSLLLKRIYNYTKEN